MSNINHTRTNVEDLLFRIARALETLEQNSISDGFFLPVSSTDALAPNSSIYYSTTASKLVFKDSVGTIHNLY